MRFHWQNLNEKSGDRLGCVVQNGRAWLNIGRTCIHWEWVFRLRPRLFLNIDLDGFGGSDSDLKIGAGFVFFCFWLCFEAPWLRWLPSNVETGIDIHDWAIWIKPWCRSMEWRSADPWWRRGLTLHLDDLLFGKAKYSRQEIAPAKDVLIPMPEGCYEATIAITESTWRWPRWFTRRRVYADLKVMRPGGIPFEGKGENSWDCGEDGLCGGGFQADTVEEAIGKIVGNVMESRRRYGFNRRGREPVLAIAAVE